ncbi:MAG: 4Fe-4S dicluster domain-containing protein [Thermodesulfovibrionales bacterium]|nr:4Fe-4S dicluster domain-containing protein [Thermodesulfovibrionales bacterium]
MSIRRRDFLKIAGVSAIAGIGGVSALSLLKIKGSEASSYIEDPKTLKGKRWAIAIDIQKFQTPEDYARVINACHSIHNVPDIGNPKEEIKWIWTESYEHSFPSQDYGNPYIQDHLKKKPFLVLCNHCDNPPCVRVCPTKATFKRKSDGIVMMDMHRCIGCRFCMAGCPYGARSFNWRDPRPYIKKINPEFPARMKGVVEKCTFCYQRIAVGLQPACVEASKGAMIFGDLADPNSEIRRVLSSRYTIRRKPELGTNPSIFYIIGG